MKVTWLCSRKVEGQVLGYYTEKQIESGKDRVRNELLDSMRRMSEWNAECLRKGSMSFFGTMYYYSDPTCRQDCCIRELSRCRDEEKSSDRSGEKDSARNNHLKRFPADEAKEPVAKYIFTCYKTMYMPVTVSVPDDSTEDEIKAALHEKMSQNYDYQNDPYHLSGEIIPVPPCATWERELTLAERIEQGIEDISNLYMYQFEWLKYYKKTIFGKYYDDEYEIDWESMQRFSLPELEDPEKDVEEIDDYWYERSDLDDPDWL